jgi:alpha,alpha-trehalase
LISQSCVPVALIFEFTIELLNIDVFLASFTLSYVVDSQRASRCFSSIGLPEARARAEKAAHTHMAANSMPDDEAATARIYCDGPLLAAVQRARIWPDSKDFVDTPLKAGAAPHAVLAAWHASPPTTSDATRAFVAQWFDSGPSQPHKSPPLPGSVRGGGDGGGDESSDAAAAIDAPLLLRDWSPDGPPFAAAMQAGHLRDFARRVHALWPSLARAPTAAAAAINDDANDDDKGGGAEALAEALAETAMTSSPPPAHRFSSLIPTPHPAIVPGERFRETYYWQGWHSSLTLFCGQNTSC